VTYPDDASFTAHADQELARIRDRVATGNLVIVTVPDGQFSYTVGLTARAQPELVVSSGSDLAALFLHRRAAGLGVGDDTTIGPGLLHWRDPRTNTRHTYTTRPWSFLAGDDPLGVVVALFGPHNALHIDHLSCPCELCARKVVVKPTGEYLRDV
jgi:hypothetical protein